MEIRLGSKDDGVIKYPGWQEPLQEQAETTLFAMGRYLYRAWVTNLPLTPAGIWYFYDGRAGIEP